ncbi:carbohydrate esterase family 4 protein [Crucibulum laeve]|uniref:Carbohydrate esterase family 4 protein n=1 Tax=Crucibulum laeve TaxID=68775 RepID=A0A5C3LG57_9AGAR|nr:carbohydrate esterase family 4 protein [Crucibulum laeve]
MLFSLAVTLGLAASALAVPHEKRARAQVISRCTVPNTIALTFDDGPHIYLRDIVNLLNSNGAKGTFFFNGNNYGCIYSTANADNVKYAYQQGHQVASHTWAHKDLTTLTWDQIHDEMWRVEQALTRITGANPAFMRPPYGNYNNLVLDASGVRGQSVVIWDFDSQDSLGASVSTQKGLIDGLISNHPSTILSLEHEVYDSTAHQVLPYFIQKLKAAGYRMVTLAECLGKNPYQSVVAPSSRDGNWHC